MADQILPTGSAVNWKVLDALSAPALDDSTSMAKHGQSLPKTKRLTPLGERILAAMHYAGYKSQGELQRELYGEGKGRGSISRYMSGTRGTSTIDPIVFLRMANLLGVDYTWLTTGQGEMTPPLQGHPPSRRSPT